MTDPSATIVDLELAATAAPGPGDAGPAAELAAVTLDRGTLVGRYVVLAKLGAGGMGVVFAAYDPELSRKVALKLLHPRLAADADATARQDARARLVREAQALARLSHPHIVAIHDVGEHRGAVWLAMEYVEGETLATWLQQRRRTWQEVLAVLTPAARGLAAAHAAGLVHRDIKPDNIIVGADGRVRVMDLGLARGLDGDAEPGPRIDAPIDATIDATIQAKMPTAAAGELVGLAARVTRVGAVMGTPAYMSPEQFRGLPVDARADIFAFCVTLWEALMGERPFAGDTLIELATSVLAGTVRPVPRDPHARRVPGWLRRVCLRGLAVAPERRFASMTALQAALARGQAQARARTWLLGAALVTGVGASAALVQRHDLATRITACEQAGARIGEVWNEAARARVRAGILASGPGFAPVTADKVMPFLDGQAQAWSAHRTRACLQADVEGTLEPALLDRAVWCLDERRMELAALLTELSRADAKVVHNAVTAAAGLPPVSPCTAREVLAALPAPPSPQAREKADAVRTALSQVGTLLSAGKYPEGLERTRTALVDAEALGWPPMTAAARRLEGALLERLGAYAEAEVASLTAYMTAAKVQAWDVAAPAAVQLVATVGGRQARHAEGRVWARHAEVAISLAGDPLGLREAGRLHTLASVQRASGAFAAARELDEQALAIREQALGHDHPDVASSLHTLALDHYAMGTYAEAKALNQRALAIREQALGPEHPDLAASLNNLALIHQRMGADAEARALYERALDIQEQALGPDHPDVAAFITNLANMHMATGAYAEAKQLNRRALAIRERALGPAHPDVAMSLNNLAAAHGATGEYAEARALYERALAIREDVLGPEHPSVALLLGNLGDLALAQDQPAEALALFERAVAKYAASEGIQEGELEIRFRLAQALVATDRARALAEARQAADGLRAIGDGGAKQLAEVEAFLASHDDAHIRHPPGP